jgi:Putative translation initiation inhibitor, yjgF family
MTRNDVHVPKIKEMYDTSLLREDSPVPAYGFGGRGFAHAIVTEGGKTLRVSGCPAVGIGGVVGKNDMYAQTIQALENLLATIEAGGGTWDDIVHMTYFFTDREEFWAKCIPARIEFFKKHSKTGKLPCVSSFGTTGLMHPDMMLEIEAIAVFD